MSSESKWHLVHTYRALARVGMVPNIYCPDDTDVELIPGNVDKSNDPVLKCLACKTVFYPGSNVWKTMKENIDEQRNNV